MILDLWYTEKHENRQGISFKIKDILFQGKSEYQEVAVVDTYAYGRVLFLDGLVMTTERDEFVYHEMITHVPLLSHKNPENVLIIGGGDGGTVREALKHPQVKKVVLCEIDGMVIDVSKKYLPSIAGKLDNPRVDIQIRDGIEYISSQKNEFDVVIIDSTDPIGPGEGLFTEVFYKSAKRALKTGGVMTSQSESPIENKKEIGLIYSMLNKVFPIVKPYIATIPTYPGNLWSWSFCTFEENNNLIKNNNIAVDIEKTTSYYNREIHKSCFVLPNFMKRLL